MAPATFGSRDRIERLATKLYLLWAGLSIGVAFLATPAKFLAPSLTLPVALDVGQHTFRVYNSLEWALLTLLMVLGIWSNGRKRWYLSALVPGAIILVQASWLIPALDMRVIAIQAGQPRPPSHLHAVYIAAEVLKLLWLLALGLGDLLSGPARIYASSVSSPGTSTTIQTRRPS